MKRALNIRIETELYEQLRGLAERENRSISNLVETLLQAHVDQQADLAAGQKEGGKRPRG